LDIFIAPLCPLPFRGAHVTRLQHGWVPPDKNANNIVEHPL